MTISFSSDTYADLLHWICLGLAKYLALAAKAQLKDKKGEKVVAQRIRAFDWSAFEHRLTLNPVRYCLSYLGKDFKVSTLLLFHRVYRQF